MTDQALISLVRERANNTCEYCQLPQGLSSISFEIDHIIAQKHGGPSDADNLALSCFYCNSYKGPNIAGFHAGLSSLERGICDRTCEQLYRGCLRGCPGCD